MADNVLDVWIPRKKNDGDEIPHYDNPDYFTMKIYHGENILGNRYVGGKISFYDHVDKDRMSLTELDNMVQGLNPDYADTRIDYWFSIGSEDDAMTKISLDADVMTMLCCVPEVRLVVLYLDHIHRGDEGLNEDEVYMYLASFDVFSQSGSSRVVIKELPDEPRKKPTCVIEEIIDEKKLPICETRETRQLGIVIREVDDAIPTQGSKVAKADPKDKGKGKMYPKGSAVKKTIDGVSGLEEELLKDIDILDYMQSFRFNLEQVNEVEFDGCESDEEDDYIPVAEDDEYDQYGVDDDDWLEEAYIGFEVNGNSEWVGPSKEALNNVEMESGKEFVNHKDMFGPAESNKERLWLALNSDGEEEVLFLEFDLKTYIKDPVFKKGMIFSSFAILRKAIRERAIRDGWEVLFIKNDRKRVRAICKSQDYPFELYAFRMQHKDSLMIKTYEPEHKCTRVFDNSMVSAKYLTKCFMERIKLNTE